MLNRNDLHEYQNFGVRHVIDNPAAGLFLDMGLGKTATTLTAVSDLYRYCEISKVLVIAPKRVAENTWTTEAANWEHLRHLKISKVIGTEKQRIAALKAEADIWVINRENVVWLIAYYGNAWPFDMLVIDELSSFKSAKAARFKALRTIRPKISRVVGLTGTPVGNGLLDLWPEMHLLDMGQRLGKTLTEYRDKYFTADPYKPYASYSLRTEEDPLIGKDYYQQKIYDRISDICISMKAEDYLQLPEKIIRDVPVRLSAVSQQRYDAFEEAAVMELAAETQITAVNAAALTTKLLQFANGAIYDEKKQYHELHDEKLEALEEIVDTAAGHPVLVFYNFKHDLDRIKRILSRFKPVELKTEQDIERWNKKEISVLLAHPASAGHGLNLQAGGNIIVWFGLTWSLELYLQANARIHRQGLQGACIIHRLITVGTIDQNVVEALDNKAKGQDALMEAVKARIEKYKKQFAA